MSYKILAKSKKHGQQEILVDEQDYIKLQGMTVCVSESGRRTKNLYAQVVLPGRRIKSLHRYIMDLTDPKLIVDHINHNTLDNRRSNLRIGSSRSNRLNTRKTTSTTQSRFIGVRWDKYRNRWRADLKTHGKYYCGGRYRLKESAALAYNILALIHHGPMATLNGISDGLYEL